MKIGNIEKGSLVEIQAIVDETEVSFRAKVDEAHDNFVMIPLIRYEGQHVIFDSENAEYQLLYMGESTTGPYVFPNVILKEFVNPKGRNMILILSNEEVSAPSDHRRYKRAKLDLKGRVRYDINVGWVEAKIENLSYSGIDFTKEEGDDLEIGDNVSLQYVDVVYRMKILIEAKIVRMNRINGTCVYGCRIYNPTQALENYIDKKIKHQNRNSR
jgi:hypothetical protein